MDKAALLRYTVTSPCTMSDTLRYCDKVVIVTGGSQGIGKGIVSSFVESGAKVVFCAIGSDAGRSLEAELNGKGPGQCLFTACDVTKEEEIQELVSMTVRRFGQIDCLVNNAGWHPPHKPIDDITADDFRYLLNLNLVSYFLAAKYALPHLRRSQGNVINLSSLVSTIGQKDAVSYVATKGAITAMTKAMAIDESRYNVRVNCISPGNVMTPLWGALAAQSGDMATTIKAGENAQPRSLEEVLDRRMLSSIMSNASQPSQWQSACSELYLLRQGPHSSCQRG